MARRPSFPKRPIHHNGSRACCPGSSQSAEPPQFCNPSTELAAVHESVRGTDRPSVATAVAAFGILGVN
jgi:hypothetical protein